MKLKDEDSSSSSWEGAYPSGVVFMSANPRGYVGSHVLMIRENPRVLHGESSQLVFNMLRITAMHGYAWPFGRGPTTRSLGDETNHHGY